MSDRIKGFVVTLDKDVRDDDARAWVDAIRMVRGVIDVQPVASNIDDLMNRVRVRHELAAKLFDALKE